MGYVLEPLTSFTRSQQVAFRRLLADLRPGSEAVHVRRDVDGDMQVVFREPIGKELRDLPLVSYHSFLVGRRGKVHQYQDEPRYWQDEPYREGKIMRQRRHYQAAVTQDDLDDLNTTTKLVDSALKQLTYAVHKLPHGWQIPLGADHLEDLDLIVADMERDWKSLIEKTRTLAENLEDALDVVREVKRNLP